MCPFLLLVCGLEGAQQEEVSLVLVLVIIAVVVVFIIVHLWCSGLLDEWNHWDDSLTPFLVVVHFLRIAHIQFRTTFSRERERR